jgi:hypothetical protein
LTEILVHANFHLLDGKTGAGGESKLWRAEWQWQTGDGGDEMTAVGVAAVLVLRNGAVREVPCM